MLHTRKKVWNTRISCILRGHVNLKKIANTDRELKTYHLKNCVSMLCLMFKLQNLHDDQFNALLTFLRGQDIFVNKLTGSGKSIIYQMALFAEMALAHHHGENTVWKSKAILVIICPLTSLMKDQVNYLQKLNISATYVTSDQPESILSSIEQGNYNLVFISPESTLNNEHWRSMLTNTVYSSCLMGIAVDKVDCITEWGLSNNNRDRSAFRKWYSCLNELRSLANNIPIMALTATATVLTKKMIFNLLEFVDPFEVVVSPNRNNISYVVQKWKMQANWTTFIAYYLHIILRKKGENAMCTIIYCQTILQCSLLYSMISNELGNDMYKNHIIESSQRMVEMMHSQTPINVKEHVLDQFSQQSGHLRVLIATNAYGMGVNCKGVKRVIHFGPSKSIQSYVQESERCGRQGEQSLCHSSS